MAPPRASRLLDWLIDVTEQTARAANRALARPEAGATVSRGAFGSPTVAADREAETVVVAALQDAPIPLNLFSEEIGHVRAPKAEWTLIADPIDGTRNAIRGIPFYCVALAIGKKSLQDVELGVVRNAINHDVYTARKGHGSYANGERLRVRPFDPTNVIVAAALDYEKRVRVDWHPHIHFRDMGSSALELCMVATGGIDLFLSTKHYLRVVDVAASNLVVLEAGGHVLDLQKKPLNAGYDLKERVSMYAMGDRRALRVIR